MKDQLLQMLQVARERIQNIGQQIVLEQAKLKEMEATFQKVQGVYSALQQVLGLMDSDDED